jgi:hypothetical protein
LRLTYIISRRLPSHPIIKKKKKKKEKGKEEEEEEEEEEKVATLGPETGR